MRGELLNRQSEIVGFLRDSSHMGNRRSITVEENNIPLNRKRKYFFGRFTRIPRWVSLITTVSQRSEFLWEISRSDHWPTLLAVRRLARVITGRSWKPSSDAAGRAFLELSARYQGR